ncbi:MAG: MYG1 family protein [Myxococcales bacterium]|nr:MYG1 family protein [Myxococcales bacterium]
MPVRVATHSGPFHADDVLAVSLIRTFLDSEAAVVRTRDAAVLDEADMVVDVGAIYDPGAGRFDHHQASYTGPLSSAGMVLAWLTEQGHVSEALFHKLRAGLVSYVDDVDNGRVAPKPDVPCFPRIVEAFNHPCRSHEDFDAAFERAAELGKHWLAGLVSEHERILEAERVVGQAMASAAESGTRVIELPEYLPWKSVYFANGGETHPTDYVIHPATDGSWRIVAIPPKLGDFGQKRPLPESWAGLTDDELEAVTGISGSVFCHKNRFIAVFRTREGAVQAIEKYDLHRRAS